MTTRTRGKQHKTGEYHYEVQATGPGAEAISTVRIRPNPGEVRASWVRPPRSLLTGLAAVGAAHTELGQRAAMAASLTDRFSESFRELGAEPYLYPTPFRCSKECGGPIRQGDLFVQVSADWKPLERAHVACVAGRKGLEGDTPDDAVREIAGRLLDELGAAR